MSSTRDWRGGSHCHVDWWRRRNGKARSDCWSSCKNVWPLIHLPTSCSVNFILPHHEWFLLVQWPSSEVIFFTTTDNNMRSECQIGWKTCFPRLAYAGTREGATTQSPHMDLHFWRMHMDVQGFVNNMSEYMLACDCIITKAGPGTIAEALICGRPILLNGDRFAYSAHHQERWASPLLHPF